MLKLFYGLFVGILLAIFVGVGVNVFYQSPVAPEYPSILNNCGKEATTEQQQAQKDYDAKNKVYMEKMKPYNRNVSIVALAIAVLFLAISLIFERRIPVIADGIMLGGVFTLLYSLGRSLASQDSKYSFAVVTVGLILSFVLGYVRFISPTKTKSSRRRKVARRR
jgi:uncharacterized membrane protein YraQ (UPF0718 family)